MTLYSTGRCAKLVPCFYTIIDWKFSFFLVKLDHDAKDGERLPLAIKDMGPCEMFPQTLSHNPNGRYYQRFIALPPRLQCTPCLQGFFSCVVSRFFHSNNFLENPVTILKYSVHVENLLEFVSVQFWYPVNLLTFFYKML